MPAHLSCACHGTARRVNADPAACGGSFTKGRQLLGRFLGRRRYERTGFILYGAAVAAARDPWLYEALAVPDTLDGRFDLVGVHVFLVIDRLGREPEPGPALAQAVFDAMFADMDLNLREMGVSDVSISRKMRAMWDAFHGRSRAYAAALASNDPGELPAALARNVWRGAPPGEAEPAALARLVRAQAAHLRGQALEALAAGRVGFLPAQEAAQ